MPITASMLRSSQLAEKTARPTRALARERSYSEELITPELSLTVSAVLASFTILSEDLSSLPLLLFARRGRSRFRAYDSLYYRLMHDQPNPEHTSMVFRELMVGHLLGWGNFFGQPIVDKKGDVQEVWPLRPDRMTVERMDGVRVYTYQTTSGKPRVFIDDEILHIPAFGFDGLIGYSRISLARNAIGLSISTEKYGSKFFSNGASVGIMYKHPGTLGETAYKHLNDSLKERASVENSHKPIILEEGMSIENLGIPPDDAQFLETRKFQVSEIARIFRVPPHMIGDVEKTTSWGSGIDSQEQGYVNHTLRPWAKRIEEYLNLRILLPQDRATYYYEHLMDGLLRGDIATRYEAYVKAINNGILTPNQALEKENINPYKGGDVHWRPANMVPVEHQDAVDQQTTNAPANQANALEPLWRDALARAMKREINDVLGAVKRFGRKNDADGFNAWVTNFYDEDHSAFLLKQVQPVMDANMRLCGFDFSSDINVYINNYLKVQKKFVLSMSGEFIESYFKNHASKIDQFISFVGNLIWIKSNEEYVLDDEMEEDL